MANPRSLARPRLCLSVLLLAILAFDLTVQVRPACSLTTLQYASPGVQVLIDETHAWNASGYFYSNTAYMRSVLSKEGYSFNRAQALNSTVLAPYDVLVTDLYKENHTGPEIKAMKDWVNDGGRLMLIGEWSDVWVPWQNNVSSAFEVSFKNWTVYDDVANYNGDSRWIEVSSFAKHPLVRGIDKVVLGSAGFIDMNHSRGVAVVAWSSVTSYVSADRVGWKKSGPWPVIGCKPYGRGRVSVVSDTSLWADSRLINSTSWQIGLFRNMAEAWSYEITSRVVDSRSNPLNEALVEVRCPNATTLAVRTNSTGQVELKGLSNGSYTMTVLWKGSQVNQTVVTVGVLEGDAIPELRARVYYLTVTVTIGILGERMRGAQVAVYSANRTQLAFGTTDKSGSIEFGQLPGGSLTVEVQAQYTATSATVNLDSDLPIDVRITLTSEVLVVTLPMVVVILGVWAYILLRWKKPPQKPEDEKSELPKTTICVCPLHGMDRSV